MADNRPGTAAAGSADAGHIVHPVRPLHRKYVGPILFLAERMAAADRTVAAEERELVDFLAQQVNMADFRSQPWYRKMTDQEACNQLDIDTAKRGALVVMVLVLKVDEHKMAEEHEYLRRIREMLHTDAVVVPKELEAHKKLAMEYLKG